jgi:hypothetical protein
VTCFHNSATYRVTVEHADRVTVYIARELIDQDHQGEAAPGCSFPFGVATLDGLLDLFPETSLDLDVCLIALAKPQFKTSQHIQPPIPIPKEHEVDKLILQVFCHSSTCIGMLINKFLDRVKVSKGEGFQTPW